MLKLLRKLPKLLVVRPGVAKTKADELSRTRKDKLNRLKKSGHYKDAAKIFKDFL